MAHHEQDDVTVRVIPQARHAAIGWLALALFLAAMAAWELWMRSLGLRGDGIDVTALLLQGATVATLMTEAERLQADLIVLGSHGHRPIYDLLVGSVAEGIVRAAKLPVLLVPVQR